MAYSKANPDKLNFASPGTGTPPHLSAERINRLRNLGLTHVSYRGSAQALTALLSNDVHLLLAGAGIGMPHVLGGKLRALAVSSSSRLPLMPDTPTFDEIGLRDVQAHTWWGLAAPAGTPGEVLEILNVSIRAAVESPAMRARFADMGVIGVANSRERMTRQLRTEAAYWARAIPEMRVEVE